MLQTRKQIQTVASDLRVFAHMGRSKQGDILDGAAQKLDALAVYLSQTDAESRLDLQVAGTDQRLPFDTLRLSAQARELAEIVGKLKKFSRQHGSSCPRVMLLANDYLAREGNILTLPSLLTYMQESSAGDLQYSELVWLRSAILISLFLTLWHILDTRSSCQLVDKTKARPLLQSIDALWAIGPENLLESLVTFEPLLKQDPANLYASLSPDTKDRYRRAVEKLALARRMNPRQLCQAALALAAREPVLQPLHMRLRSHIGYYLIDEGASLLLERRKLGMLGTITQRLRRVNALPLFVLLYGGTSLGLLWGTCMLPNAVPTGLWGLAALLPLAVISSQAAFVMAGICISTLLPRADLPSFDFRLGIPEEYRTIIALPSRLISEEHVKSLVASLDKHYCIAGDRHVSVVLLTEFGDRQQGGTNERDRSLLCLCRRMVEELNQLPQYKENPPFFLLHRNLQYSPTQRSWIGRERKRGKIASLVAYISRGVDCFIHTVGEIEELRGATYLLVIDDNTWLTAGTPQRMVATHIHPLNYPHLDRDGRTVLRGFGIMQPAILTSPPPDDVLGMARPDQITRNLLQDAFGECNFMGQGLIHIETYDRILDKAVPEECVLSHDVIEGGFLRAGAPSGAVLIETPPSSHEDQCNRQHRWTRGDWQNLIWLKSRKRSGRLHLPRFGIANIVENVRTSFVPIATAILLVEAVAFHRMLGLSLALLILFPSYFLGAVDFIAAVVTRQKKLLAPTCWGICLLHVRTLVFFCNAGHNAAISVDAIVRTCIRLITKRNLLDWRNSSSLRGRMAGNICDLYTWLGAVIASATIPLLLLHTKPLAELKMLLLVWGFFPVLHHLIAQWVRVCRPSTPTLVRKEDL